MCPDFAGKLAVSKCPVDIANFVMNRTNMHTLTCANDAAVATSLKGDLSFARTSDPCSGFSAARADVLRTAVP